MLNQSFVIISLQILISLFAISLTFYLRQKGKNQANKEDLKKLTQIVEEVKKDNNKEIELLKASLSLLNDKEKQMFGEGKEAITLFFASLNTWIWDSLNIYIHEYNHANYQEISTRLIAMRDSYNKTNVSFSKVKLMIDDENLIATGHEAIIKTLELHHFKEGLLKRLISVLSWEKIFIDQLVNKETDFSKMGSDVKSFYQEQAREREKEKKEIKDEYFKRHMDFFTPAKSQIESFKEVAKEFLKMNINANKT